MENLDYEKQVAAIVNEERTMVGVPALVFSDDLSYVARAKSTDMAVNQYFSHVSPTYGDPFQMLARFGIDFTSAAENIAAGFATPRAVMIAWMNSPEHRNNILSPSFTEIGVGYFSDADGRNPIWTQLFIAR